MLAKKFLAVAVLGYLGVASSALADHGHSGGSHGRGHAYGHYRSAPAVVSARVVNVQPMVSHASSRPRSCGVAL